MRFHVTTNEKVEILIQMNSLYQISISASETRYSATPFLSSSFFPSCIPLIASSFSPFFGECHFIKGSRKRGYASGSIFSTTLREVPWLAVVHIGTFSLYTNMYWHDISMKFHRNFNEISFKVSMKFQLKFQLTFSRNFILVKTAMKFH